MAEYLVANDNGELVGKFTVPGGIPAGTVLVEFIGSQGSRGTATYTSSGTITTQQRRTVTTVYTNYDPLAETFTLTQSRHIAGIDLMFIAKGGSRVTVQIRETAVGFPNKTVIAQASVNADDININGTFTRVLFDNPVYLGSGVEYAVVILTDDAVTSVGVAELGKYDSAHSTWVTSQAYSTGVLLSSSNASTWTAHHDLDLCFRLLACKFTETNHVINLGDILTSNHTDYLTLANVERPSALCNAEFVYTDNGGNVTTIPEDVPAALSIPVNGNVSLGLRLKGTATNSPVVYPGIQAAVGTISATADYVTRSITAGTQVKVSVIFEKNTPGASSIAVYVQNNDSTWQLVQLEEGASIGDGWVECKHVVENFTAASTRVKLVLTGSTSARPRVRNLKVVVV